MTQEEAIQDYLDAIDVMIRQKLAAASAYFADRTVLADHGFASPGVWADAQKHAALDALKVVAYERWYASNPPHVRRLPHVLVQRDYIVDRSIEPRALPPGSVARGETGIMGGPARFIR